MPIGCKNLEKHIRTLFENHRLSFEKISIYGTPRRLAVYVEGLVEGTPAKIQERRGLRLPLMKKEILLPRELVF